MSEGELTSYTVYDRISQFCGSVEVKNLDLDCHVLHFLEFDDIFGFGQSG